MSEYDDLTEPEREQYNRRLREFQQQMWSHATPIRISQLGDEGELKYNTATAVLIIREGELFVLTAQHVFQAFRDLQTAGQDVALVVSNYHIAVPDIRYESAENDVIVLAVPLDALKQIDSVPYEADGRWPPKRISIDDGVAVCGHPMALREESDNEIQFRDLSFFGSPSTVGEQHFTMLLEGEWVSIGRSQLESEHMSFLGGLSGAPVFTHEGHGPILVGIVSAKPDGLPILRVSSLAHLPSVLDRRNSG